jgi:hypothetical protein
VIKATLRAHTFEDFHSTWMPTVIEQDPSAAPRLADACLVVGLYTLNGVDP